MSDNPNKVKLVYKCCGSKIYKGEKCICNNLNNETIGQSAEFAICIGSNITCYISENRINKNISNRLCSLLEKEEILKKLPDKISESCGYKNGSIDFKLKNGETLSLKTLKYKEGKVCPQKIGQPTLKSWDKIWGTEWKGELEYNNKRWEFIKNNIYKYLNKMLENIFCCDYLIILKNCGTDPYISFFDKKLLKNKLDYFTDQDIIYTREIYDEKWNEKKKKYSEMSCTIKIKMSGDLVNVGEFQFHKNSRKELKFRFWDGFLQKLF
jgi:hypothetical protein